MSDERLRGMVPVLVTPCAERFVIDNESLRVQAGRYRSTSGSYGMISSH